MNILGLNYYYHDKTASIIQDGQQLIVAIEEERLTRDNYTWNSPFKPSIIAMEIDKLKPTYL